MKPNMRKAPFFAVAIVGALLCSGAGGANAADVPRAGTAGRTNPPGQASPAKNSPAAVTAPQKGQTAAQPAQPPSPQPTATPAAQPNRPGAGAPSNPSPGAIANAGRNPAQVPKNAGRPPVIVVTESGIDADVQGPLSETLRAMAGMKLFDMKGPMPAGEEITVQFSGLTLEEALKKLMRGYNYVLMEQGNAPRPVLVLLGRIQRSPSGTVYAPQPVQAPPMPVGAQASPSGVPPTTGPVSTSLRNNRRPPVPAAPDAQPGAEAGQTAGATAQPGASGPSQIAPGEGQPQQASGQAGQQQGQTTPQQPPQPGQGQTTGQDRASTQPPKSEPNMGVKF